MDRFECHSEGVQNIKARLTFTILKRDNLILLKSAILWQISIYNTLNEKAVIKMWTKKYKYITNSYLYLTVKNQDFSKIYWNMPRRTEFKNIRYIHYNITDTNFRYFNLY